MTVAAHTEVGWRCLLVVSLTAAACTTRTGFPLQHAAILLPIPFACEVPDDALYAGFFFAKGRFVEGMDRVAVVPGVEVECRTEPGSARLAVYARGRGDLHGPAVVACEPGEQRMFVVVVPEVSNGLDCPSR